MSTSIVCATRGGVGSRAVQNAAIQRAKQTGEPLVFLYVVDTGVTSLDEQGLAPSVLAELNWMGKTLLRVAERHALDAGLAPDIAIREGSVPDEIAAFINERRASILLIGAARHHAAGSDHVDRTQRFADRIQSATGVPVEIVVPEKGQE